MATNKEIETGAKAIAEDFGLPGGAKKKLARVVEGHLAWFEAVEARGMTWADMARLLCDEPVSRGRITLVLKSS